MFTKESISRPQPSVTFADERKGCYTKTASKRRASNKLRNKGSKGKLDCELVHKTVKVDFNELSKEIFTPDKKFKHNINWRAILKNGAHETK